MSDINWCVKKIDGLKLISSNSNLANAYIIKSEQALESINLNKYKDWKISASYYSLYFALYSLLTKIGVKSKIHSCTIAFAKHYLTDFLTE